MNKNIIDIKKIKKIFFHNNKKIELFKNVNISLKSGELVALTGPSGSGKTSLLHIIALLDQQTDGEISFMGKNVSQLNDNQKDLIRRNNISIIFQNNNLLSDFTALENVSLPLIIRGESQINATSKAEILLKKINLQKRMHHFPNELSGGEQQRVALIRALATSPDILLLDEPFSSLDIEIKESLIKDVKELLKNFSIASIIVTHDQFEAFSIADKIAVINNGEILQIGTPYEIYNEPSTKFVADFVGLGTFLPAKFEGKDTLNTPLGLIKNFSRQNFKESDDLEILIRPDDVIHDDSSKMKAVVVDKHFRGAEFLYELKYKQKFPLLCYALSHHDHKLGESIGIEVDCEHCVVFKK